MSSGVNKSPKSPRSRSRSRSPKRQSTGGDTKPADATVDKSTEDSTADGTPPDDDTLNKNKRNVESASTGGVSQNPDDPLSIIISPDLTTSTDFAAHLPDLRNGNFDNARKAYDKVWENADRLQPDEWAAAMRRWIDGVFADEEVLAHASTHPFFFDMISSARQLIEQPGYGDLVGCTDKWLNDHLDKLDPPSAASFAAYLVATGWDKNPDIIGGELRKWIRRVLGAGGLNKAEGGLCARYLNMLWNAGDYDMICGLIEDGINTAKPAFCGMEDGPGWEGSYSGYIQPIEHLLGNYLRLVSLKPETLGSDKDAALEVAFLGGRSPGSKGLSEDEKLERGKRKVAGAKQVLDALAAKKSAKILTDYSAVQGSTLLKAFENEPGTIWGFEHVRLPYVQAAHHILDEKRKQPLRMWELWEVVKEAMEKETYEKLLADPGNTIPKLVAAGVTAMDKLFENRPAEYLWWKPAQFKKAFEEQCTAYLWSLAEQPPRAKYATAEKRGHKPTAYLGALGCSAGLWWAKRQDTPIYYCLDGLEYDDVINYKMFKTGLINTYLVKGGKPYPETITMVEIREILNHWDDFKKVVKFTRQGEFVDVGEILDMKTKMEDANKAAKGKRLAPTNVPEFVDAIRKLDPELLATLKSDEDIMRVVAQVELLKMAISAKSDKVLAAYLQTKGSRVLFEQAILPEGLAATYKAMVDEKNADLKKQLGADLVKRVEDKSTGVLRVCDELRIGLVDAIKRHSGA